MEENEILPQTYGFYQDYDINVEPGVFNSVATAVLQLVLTLLPDELPLGFPEEDNNIPFSKTALNMSSLYKPGVYENIMLGLLHGHALTFDPAIGKSFREYLGGLNLVARAIQQGRDHGLPPYVVWRPLCGRNPAQSFDDLIDVMEPERLINLRQIYADVADIDLFTGIISERTIDGAVVGATAACLLSLQFKILRRTDRYWYENDIPPAAFSKEKLYEIRQRSLASLLCDNVPTLNEVPLKAFERRDSFLNSPVQCSNLKSIDIMAWKTKGGKVHVPEDILHTVVQKGKQVVQKRKQMEKLIFEKGLFGASKSTLGSAYANNKPNKASLIMADTSVLLEAASHELISIMKDRRPRRQIGNSENNFNSFDFNLPSVDISGLVPPAPLVRSCVDTEEHRACQPRDKYRTFSGHCNNLANDNFGRSNTVFARMLPAAYDDDVAKPRSKSTTGSKLPSPRTISTAIHDDVPHPHSRYTLMVMQFGQFLDHDITFTPLNKGFQNSILDCRDCESQDRVSPECLPIPVPDNDPYYPLLNRSTGRHFCIAFTRYVLLLKIAIILCEIFL